MSDLDEVTIGADWLFPLSQATLTSDRVWTIAGCVFCLTTLPYLIWRNYKSKYIENETKNSSLLWWITLTTIGMFALNQLSALFIVFPWVYNGDDCLSLSIINTILYFGSKLSLWVYSIARLHAVFSKSGTLAYPEWFLKALVVFFCFECIVINILHAVFDEAIVYDELVCVVLTADFIPAVLGSIDVISNILCFWLFYAKMRKLRNLILNLPRDGVSPKMLELETIITKYTTLTGFSALSTILLGMSVAITPMLFTMLTIDTFVNVICLLLYDKRFDKYYKSLCCCFTMCVSSKRKKLNDIAKQLRAKATGVVMGDPSADAVGSNEVTNQSSNESGGTKGVSYATQTDNTKDINLSTTIHLAALSDDKSDVEKSIETKSVTKSVTKADPTHME